MRFAETALAETFAAGDRVARLRSLEPKLRDLVKAEAKRMETPGLAVGVVLDGKLLFTAFEGFADPATKRPLDADASFRIGSITKTFTASAIVKLRDEGKLRLDDPAQETLPELAALRYPTKDSRPVTLRQLLTHTSGLPRLGHFDYTHPDHDPTEREVLESGDVALTHAPGTLNVYSNLAVGFAGLVVTRASGTPLRTYLHDRLLAPIGMNATVWTEADVPEAHRVVGFSRDGKELKAQTPWRLGASEGAGGLYSTVNDMARWIAFQLDAYPPRNDADDAPLRRSSRRELHAPQAAVSLTVLPASGELGEDLVDVYEEHVGLGFRTETTCFAERVSKHSGAIDGFQSSMMFAPKRGFGVIVLSSLIEESADPLARRVIRMLATNGFDERQRRGPVAPELSRGLETLLRLQNAAESSWDEAAYRAAMSDGHLKNVKESDERRELSGYHARHGQCRAGETKSLEGARGGVFSLACERGRLEMRLWVEDDGKISGFGADSFGVPPTKAQQRAAEHVAALFTKFDAKAFRAHLIKAFPDEAEERAWFGRKAERYGVCRLARSLDQQDDKGNASFLLTCERGSDLKLVVRPGDEKGDEVAGFRVRSVQEGMCPAPATGGAKGAERGKPPSKVR